MAATLRVPRTRTTLSAAALLILLGAWGGLVPFVGPYFHYAYTPDKAWAYTSGRLWLEIVPALGAIAGGVILLISAFRSVALLGAFLAGISGAWFAVGSVIGPVWSGTALAVGAPVGATVTRAVEQIGFFTGLGVAIVWVAVLALGRFSVTGAWHAKAPAGPAPDMAEEPADSGAAVG